MAHNFKLIGDIYVSKDGSDVTGDGSRDNPYLTIREGLLNSASGETIVVGSGEYRVSNGSVDSVTGGRKLYADGKLVIKPASNFDFTIQNVNTFVNGIIFIGFNNISTPRLNIGNVCIITNCEFYDCVINTLSINVSYVRCIFYDCVLLAGSQSKFEDCILINTFVDICISFGGSYANNSTKIGYSGPSVGFRNNCFQGVVEVSGIEYRLYKEFDGSNVTPTPTEQDIVNLFSDVYTTRLNFNEDPLFSNFGKFDFKNVLDNSNLLNRSGLDVPTIGNVQNPLIITMADSELNPSHYTEDVSLATIVGTSGLDWRFDGVDDKGYVLTEAIQLGTIDKIVKKMDFGYQTNFNSASTSGAADNSNVLAVYNYENGTIGANPRRLTYEMRWSTQVSQPLEDDFETVGSGWDNNGYTSEGEFVVFEIGTIPKMDNNGRGNGDPLFNTETQGNIAAKWVQCRITIRKGIGYS